jgi:hypothetical protein
VRSRWHRLEGSWVDIDLVAVDGPEEAREDDVAFEPMSLRQAPRFESMRCKILRPDRDMRLAEVDP